jgi:hypothetical protein
MSAAANELTVPQQYATIQQALDAAANGDRVLVDSGTYPGNITFLGKNVSLESRSGPNVTVIEGHLTDFYTPAVTIGPGGAIVGFTITGGAAYFGGGMEIHDVGDNGPLVRGNIFDGNTAFVGGFGSAIAGNNASATIENNVFRNNIGDLQHVAGVVAFVNSSEPRITNNLFENNTTRAINLTVTSLNCSLLIVNNTIVNNPAGIHIDGRFGDLDIIVRNNIIANNDIGIERVFGNGNINIDHNLVFGNDIDFADIPDQTGMNGNISVPPAFVSPSAGNYRLQLASPAVDAGIGLEAPANDLDGNARPVDGNLDGTAEFDLGAYELQRFAAFDVIVQDDRTHSFLQFSSVTGDYQFVECAPSGIYLFGTGAIRRVGGCQIQLRVYGTVQVSAVVYPCRARGTATIQVSNPARTLRLLDSDTRNDAAGCE